MWVPEECWKRLHRCSRLQVQSYSAHLALSCIVSSKVEIQFAFYIFIVLMVGTEDRVATKPMLCIIPPHKRPTLWVIPTTTNYTTNPVTAWSEGYNHQWWRLGIFTYYKLDFRKSEETTADSFLNLSAQTRLLQRHVCFQQGFCAQRSPPYRV